MTYLQEGQWQPIWVSYYAGGPQYCEPLFFAKTDPESVFNACNCKSSTQSVINCNYCPTADNLSVSWFI